MNDDSANGEYIVSDARTRMFISGAVGISDRNGGEGYHDPEMKLRCKSCDLRAVVNAERMSGVISRSPDSSREERGFGDEGEKGGEVGGRVDAHVKRRLDSVTWVRAAML